MASEELEKSLRADIDNYINSRLSGLQEEIKRLQSQLNESFTRLSERATSSTQTDTSVGVSILEHIRAAHERGIEDASAESAHTQVSSDVAILKASIEELDDQRSQADILNTLVNRAASFAPRVAFFVVKNDQIIGWRARGLEGTVGDNAVRDISMPLTSATVLSDVVNTRATWSGSPGSHADNHELLSKFGDEPPQRMAAIPLIARGKAVAVLYADSAALESDAISLEALESLVRVAGMAVELLAVTRPAPAARPAARIEPQPPRPSRRAPAREEEPAAVSDATQEAASPAPQAEAVSPVAAEPQAETVAQAEPAPAEEAAPPAPPQAEQQPAQFANPLGTARRYSSRAEAELPVEVSEEEKPQHVGARRFARLLVSEINMYNEPKVKEGREAGDLYDRLRDAIDKSREMYDKRYAASVGSRYDYFHHELVNTLAEGDESKLGNGYPGSSVSV
ncbi:MAG: GAF domain-containing protein [Acidobacteria bacterium]|nr:GAF domain-containing protein [Acidobacteriota bacterium]